MMMMSQRIRRDSAEQSTERRLPVVDADWYQTHGQGD
jgi:hypothetical protein